MSLKNAEALVFPHKQIDKSSLNTVSKRFQAQAKDWEIGTRRCELSRPVALVWKTLSIGSSCNTSSPVAEQALLLMISTGRQLLPQFLVDVQALETVAVEFQKQAVE